MKTLLVTFILLYKGGIQAFQDLTACSVGNSQGICMVQSDCYTTLHESSVCGDKKICCLETNISYQKCFEYGTKYSISMRLNITRYRIIGGNVAATNEFPFMVAIGREPENSEEEKWFCGGSIISENFVITAAHCINKGDITSYLILAGSSLLNSPKAQVGRPAEAIIHPKFIPWKMGYDVALLRMARPFQLSANVFPICLLSPTNLPYIFKGLAMGFGVEHHETTKRFGKLKKVVLDIFSTEKCDNSYPSIVEYGGKKPTLLCAGVVGGGKDTCQGDSGGPLTVPLLKPVGQYGLFGVTSAGLSCGLSGSPGLYIKVPYFLSWIESYVWKEEIEKINHT